MDEHLRLVAQRLEVQPAGRGATAAGTAQRVQSILAAAEAHALDTRVRALAAAHAVGAAAQADAERKRAAAERQAEEYVAEVRAVTENLLARLQTHADPERRTASRLGPLTPEGVTGLAVLSAVAAAPAAAHADALVRLANAVPGSGAAQLGTGRSGAGDPAGEAAFGEVSARHLLKSGRVTLRLTDPQSGQTLASASTRLRDGRRYTVVALLSGGRLTLKSYADGRAPSRGARLRVIHAAPELGNPDLTVDGKTVAEDFRYEAATPYLSLEPGKHRYAARGPQADAMLSGRVALEPARAYTGLVVGSRGERLRVVLALDDAGAGGGGGSASTTPTSRPGQYTVRPGDSLWTIAEGRLGAGATDAAVAQQVVRVWSTNKQRIGTGDPDLIYPGTVLRV